MARIVLILALIFGVVSGRASAEPRPMSPVDMVEIPRLSAGTLSPDGQYFAYLRSETDWSENKIFRRLRVIDRASGAALAWPIESDDEEADSRIWWKPDSSGFIFLKKPDGAEKRQAHFYNIENRNQTQLTHHGEAILDVFWAPDEAGFYFLSTQQQSSDESQLLADGWIIPPFESNAQREVWYFNLETEDSSAVVAGPHSIRQVSVSQDGRYLVYSHVPDHRFDSIYRGEVFSLDLIDKTTTRWTGNNHGEGQPRISPDGRSIAYIATVNADDEPFYEPKVFVKTGRDRPKRLLAREAMEALAFAWDQSGDGLYILGNTGLRANLYHYSLATRELRPLTEGDQNVIDWSYDPQSDRHLLRIETAQSPGDYQLMSGNGSNLERLTDEYADWADRFVLPEQTDVSWRGRWGARIEGLLVYPIGYEPGKRYPLVTITHGGPHSSTRFGNWFTTSYLPVLAGQGFMVFLPNHRGGTGYGDAFMRDMAGRYFRNAHHDVMNGIDAMIDRGLADPDQLIKMGWSAGGHMVNKLITHTDRFKVASSGAGGADFFSLHGESDARFARQFMFGGTPFQRNAPRNRYAQDSPIKNAWRVSTPTLFFVGENDVRVPPTQSILMYRAVESTGTPTVLFQAKNEPHNFRKPTNLLFKINKELQWYEWFARGERYEAILPDQAYLTEPPSTELTQAASELTETSSP